MRTLIPILILVLFWSDPGLAAWEDSPECPARMAVTRQATRDFYRGFALPGASAEQNLHRDWRELPDDFYLKTAG